VAAPLRLGTRLFGDVSGVMGYPYPPADAYLCIGTPRILALARIEMGRRESLAWEERLGRKKFRKQDWESWECSESCGSDRRVSCDGKSQA
jgi:hypothetical protein